jgi:ribose/xylose/arabinose/galactoside ABC-type transport system permease subunit
MDLIESLFILVLFTAIAVYVRRTKEPLGPTPDWDARLRRLVLVLPMMALVFFVASVVAAIA